MKQVVVKRKLELPPQGRKKKADADESLYPGRIPRVSKLMALAIRFDRLLREGLVKNQTELAQLGHVTCARVTQIMNLLNLAPDIQEEILFLPLVKSGKDSVAEKNLRQVAAAADWGKQRRVWNHVFADANGRS